MTPREEDILIKTAALRSGTSVEEVRNQVRQARLAHEAAKLDQRRKQKQEEIDRAKRRLIAEFNRRYFVVNEGGKAMVWQPMRDPTLGNRLYYQRSRVSDLRILYMNRTIQVGETKNGKSIRRNVADVWLDHPDRRQFIHGVVFDPSGTERPGVFNLWQDFAVTPKQGSWQKMQDHLLNIVCAGNRQHYDYLRKWLARVVQFPAKQGETAIVLKGLQGCGKSVLGVALVRICGQHGFKITNSVHLVGKFNQHLRDCIMLFADEAFFPGDRQNIGTLNAIITQPELTIEGKGANVVQAPNFIHLIMASDQDWVVPARLDARRFCVFDVLPDKIGDRAYFKALWAELDNGGLEAMLFDLLHEDLTDFEHRDIPDTAGLQRQKRLSLQTEFLWWEEVLQRGYVFRSKLGLENEFRKWFDPVSMEVLYASYREFAREKHERRPLSREDLGKFMVEVKARPTRRRNLVVGEHLVEEAGPFGGSMRHAKTIVATERAYGYEVGDLDGKARPGFLVATGLPIVWQDQMPGHKDDPD